MAGGDKRHYSGEWLRIHKQNAPSRSWPHPLVHLSSSTSSTAWWKGWDKVSAPMLVHASLAGGGNGATSGKAGGSCTKITHGHSCWCSFLRVSGWEGAEAGQGEQGAERLERQQQSVRQRIHCQLVRVGPCPWLRHRQAAGVACQDQHHNPSHVARCRAAALAQTQSHTPPPILDWAAPAAANPPATNPHPRS
jgi:hypothetical protein